MILLIGLATLFYFYKSGGFTRIIEAARLDTEPEPVKVYREPQKIQAEPQPHKIDRQKLEMIARNCLTAAGCKIDTYYYCRNKTDLELMDIIKDYNIYHID